MVCGRRWALNKLVLASFLPAGALGEWVSPPLSHGLGVCSIFGCDYCFPFVVTGLSYCVFFSPSMSPVPIFAEGCKTPSSLAQESYLCVRSGSQPPLCCLLRFLAALPESPCVALS